MPNLGNTAPASPERLRASSRLALTTRHHGPDDPRIPELKRDFAAEQLADHIRAVVAAAPPLTDEQRTRLSALLAAPGDGVPDDT